MLTFTDEQSISGPNGQSIITQKNKVEEIKGECGPVK